MDNLWTTRRKAVQNPVDNSAYLTPVLPSSSASERLGACSSLRSLVVVGVLCLFLGANLIKMQPAQASEVDHYKLYAHSRIINYTQFKCFVSIINKENRQWDVRARNGSHYGLGQMRSKHYRNLDGYRQIDATIKYIKARYSNPCKAWAFHERHGYY